MRRGVRAERALGIGVVIEVSKRYSPGEDMCRDTNVLYLEDAEAVPASRHCSALFAAPSTKM
jgi:hypothetical protein